jgi:hypothetical protein
MIVFAFLPESFPRDVFYSKQFANAQLRDSHVFDSMVYFNLGTRLADASTDEH